VEQLNVERNEKLNRVKIVEREKDLEGPMKEAVAFVKVENEVTKTKNVVCQKNIYDNQICTEELEKKQDIDDSAGELK
jgi:structural maintenance of chromosome 4